MRLYLATAAFCLSLFSGLVASAQTPPPTTPWELQNSTTKAGLRGIHAVGNGVAWASGTNGTILRTEDGGYMWQSCAMPPGAEKLDFRGIWAWDANTAVAMSSGPGDLSRLYKTTDGCSSWKLLYTNPDKEGFWDALQFLDKNQGTVLGDPVGGKFVLFITADGGNSWQPGNRPEAKPDEGAFAASNSALASAPSSDQIMNLSPDDGWSFFGTGGKSGPSILRLTLDGKPIGSFEKDGAKFLLNSKWARSPVPLASGNEASGVFSLAFRDQDHGIAVGGDYKKPNEFNGTAAYTSDGGKTWTAATNPPHGYRSAVAWDAADKAHPGYWIAVGTNGSDVSYDDGKTWQPLDNGNWNALSLPWVVGPEGRIAKLVSLKSAGTSEK